MATRNSKHRFKWTEQCKRVAWLLSAMGYSNRRIAECLNCSGSSVGKFLGPKQGRCDLSPAEWLKLFEQFDAQRNLEEVIIAASGSTQQARLRTSLRARKSKHNQALGDPSERINEELADEQLRRALESLVGETQPGRSGP